MVSKKGGNKEGIGVYRFDSLQLPPHIVQAKPSQGETAFPPGQEVRGFQSLASLNGFAKRRAPHWRMASPAAGTRPCWCDSAPWSTNSSREGNMEKGSRVTWRTETTANESATMRSSARYVATTGLTLAMTVLVVSSCGRSAPVASPENAVSNSPRDEQATCRSNDDCLRPARCSVPRDSLASEASCHLYVTGPSSEVPGCGADVDCPPQQRCYRSAPSGVWSPPVCCAPPGCQSDRVCGEGNRCDENGHCVPISCTTDDECPTVFQCSSGLCSRRTCSDDSACSSGFCVFRVCRTQLGTCRQPRPTLNLP